MADACLDDLQVDVALESGNVTYTQLRFDNVTSEWQRWALLTVCLNRLTYHRLLLLSQHAPPPEFSQRPECQTQKLMCT